MTSSDIKLITLVHNRLVLSRVNVSWLYPIVIKVNPLTNITLTWFIVDDYLCRYFRLGCRLYIFDPRYLNYLKAPLYIAVDVLLICLLSLPFCINTSLRFICLLGTVSSLALLLFGLNLNYQLYKFRKDSFGDVG